AARPRVPRREGPGRRVRLRPHRLPPWAGRPAPRRLARPGSDPVRPRPQPGLPRRARGAGRRGRGHRGGRRGRALPHLPRRRHRLRARGARTAAGAAAGRRVRPPPTASRGERTVPTHGSRSAAGPVLDTPSQNSRGAPSSPASTSRNDPRRARAASTARLRRSERLQMRLLRAALTTGAVLTLAVPLAAVPAAAAPSTASPAPAAGPRPASAAPGATFHLADNDLRRTTHVFTYGRPGDEVLVGDWDGDGVDTLAVRRGTSVHIAN